MRLARRDRLPAFPQSLHHAGHAGAEAPASRSPSLAEVFDRFSKTQKYESGQTILIHGAPAERRYQVVSGTVRCCTFTEDGHRQIFRFVRTGDFFGFADFEEWHFTAEAVDEVVLRSIPYTIFEREAAADQRIAREVRRHVSDALATLERQLVMLSFLRAEERLLWFLTEQAGTCEDLVQLPMTRQDIGDHLGLSLETVSRAFSTLRRQGKIELHGSVRYRMLEPEGRALDAA